MSKKQVLQGHIEVFPLEDLLADDLSEFVELEWDSYHEESWAKTVNLADILRRRTYMALLKHLESGGSHGWPPMEAVNFLIEPGPGKDALVVRAAWIVHEPVEAEGEGD